MMLYIIIKLLFLELLHDDRGESKERMLLQLMHLGKINGKE